MMRNDYYFFWGIGKGTDEDFEGWADILDRLEALSSEDDERDEEDVEIHGKGATR